ncbi:16582_t:CDS:2 [Entrophospora sp. SA101]|nr:16582_t:CDS:2 [Entrophospora sp. SA101]
MRSDALRLSSEDYDYIMQYKDAKSKPLDMLRDKYPMSNTHVVTSSLYEIEKLGGISGAKKETIPPVILQETEDVLELHNRSQKEQKKVRASGQILASKLIVP